jgi:hypothetical protein
MLRVLEPVAGLDNSRFMHGRNAIVNAEERVILTNFGFLNFAKRSEEDPIDPPWRSSMQSEYFLKSIARL